MVRRESSRTRRALDEPLCRAPGRVIAAAVQTPALLQRHGGEHDDVGGAKRDSRLAPLDDGLNAPLGLTARSCSSRRQPFLFAKQSRPQSMPTRTELDAALARYPEALSLRAKASKTSADLVQLDSWYRTDLRNEVHRRRATSGDEAEAETWLARDELSKLMQWKLAVRIRFPFPSKQVGPCAHENRPLTAFPSAGNGDLGYKTWSE